MNLIFSGKNNYEKRVEKATKKLELPPEDITKEIPLRLVWKEGCV